MGVFLNFAANGNFFPGQSHYKKTLFFGDKALLTHFFMIMTLLGPGYFRASKEDRAILMRLLCIFFLTSAPKCY
jgi:hypothetical protein